MKTWGTLAWILSGIDVYKRQIQHVAGMESSEYIVAINSNDTAPIFDVADLGIVGDVKAIVPRLTEAIAKRKAEKAAQ